MTIHAYMNDYIDTCICTHPHIDMHIDIHVETHVIYNYDIIWYVHTLQIHLHMHICIDSSMYTYTILDKYMCIYPCIYIHIYTYSYLYCIRSSLTDVPLTERRWSCIMAVTIIRFRWQSLLWIRSTQPWSRLHSSCRFQRIMSYWTWSMTSSLLNSSMILDGCDVAVDSHQHLSHSDHHAKVHDRMPVFLTPESAPTQLPFMQGLLCPFLKG